jgi:hypothetical protein
MPVISFQSFSSPKLLTVLPEVLIVIKLVKTLLGFHENRSFITMVVVDKRWTQFTPSLPISILILSWHLF